MSQVGAGPNWESGSPVPVFSSATCWLIIWLWRPQPLISLICQVQQMDRMTPEVLIALVSPCMFPPSLESLLPREESEQCHGNARPGKVAGESPVTAGRGQGCSRERVWEEWRVCIR